MSAVNTETVVMMGAALAGVGNAQAQEASVNGERSINWDEARNLADRGQEEQALRAELREMLKEQVLDMAKAVSRVLDNYNLDELKDVKATLKADGETLNYMIGENKFELSGGFDGKPLKCTGCNTFRRKVFKIFQLPIRQFHSKLTQQRKEIRILEFIFQIFKFKILTKAFDFAGKL